LHFAGPDGQRAGDEAIISDLGVSGFSQIDPGGRTGDRAIVVNDLLPAGQHDSVGASEQSCIPDVDTCAQFGAPETGQRAQQFAIDVDGVVLGASVFRDSREQLKAAATGEDLRLFLDIVGIVVGRDVERFGEKADLIFGCHQSIFRNLCLIGGETDYSAGRCRWKMLDHDRVVSAPARKAGRQGVQS
jgi:hypothetical protein